MRMVALVGFVVALASQVVAGEAITAAQVEYWTAHIGGGRSMDVLLAEIERGPQQPWPSVVSSQCKSPLPPDTPARHAAFRSLAQQLTNNLERYEQSLSTLSDDASAEHARSLLTLRDYLVARASYINWILADEVDRVVLVNVAKRLVKNEALVPSIAELVQPLGRWPLDLDGFMAIVKNELGRDLRNKTPPQATGQALVLALMNELDPGSFRLYSSSPERMRKEFSPRDLLGGQDLDLLLLHLVTTDGLVHGALPRAVRYGQLAGTVSVDDHTKIWKVLEREQFQPTLAEEMAGHHQASLAVSELFDMVKSGRINWLLPFKFPELGTER